MTAETLKPFITPQSVDHFPATHSSTTHRKRNLLAIGLSVVTIVLITVLLGFTIWNSMRVRTLETEVTTLKLVVENMHKRLGINYLEDLHDFEKEYTNALIDDPVGEEDNDDNNDDDDDDDDKDNADEDESNDSDDIDADDDEYDEIIESYDDLIKKFKSYDDDDEFFEGGDGDEEDTSDDDNLYDDFEKFKDSKKKKQSIRKSRSIARAPNGLPLYEESYLTQLNKTSISSEAAQQDSASSSQQQAKRLQHPTMRPQSAIGLDTLSNAKGNHKRHIVADHNYISRRSPLRQRSHRRRKVPVVKSAKSTNLMNSITLTPAAHFHLHRKVPDRHAAIKVESYPGDMYIGHPSWSNEIATEHYFQLDNGVLTVRETGLYYVYAQVCYNNTHDQNGFVIFHGHKPFLQCLNTVPTNMPLKIHTCHTSGLIHLRPNETLHLRDFHSDRNAILKDSNNRSYFGLIKI